MGAPWVNVLSRPTRMKLHRLIDDYLKTDQLQDYRPYEKQRLFHMAARKYRNRLLHAGNQNGKGLVPWTPVLTSNGFCEVKDLKIGNEIYGLNGELTRVEGVFHRGHQDCYRVTTSDCAELIVDSDHLWMVRKSTGRKPTREWQLKHTEQLLSKTRWDLPSRPVVQYSPADLPIDPYFIGCLIGDGGLTQRSVTLTSTDPQLVKDCQAAAKAIGSEMVEKKVSEGKPKIEYRFRKIKSFKSNPLVNALDELGLQGKTSHDKFVPEIYMQASKQQRLELIRGLMDTDGTAAVHPNGTGQRSYSTVSKQLAEDVIRLLRSIGMMAVLKKKKGLYQGKRHYSWRVSIRTGGDSLFRLTRKKKLEEQGMKKGRGMHLIIRKVEPVGIFKTVCIKVAAEDGMFLAGEGLIPTHNTFPAGAEFAMHLTGEYSDRWPGHRFDHPITAWAAGKTGDATRDNPQRVLLGLPKNVGTGFIPRRCLTSMFGMAKGTSSLYDFYG